MTSIASAQIGLAAYIDQQLHPERIADTGMTARLAGFETLNKSSRQLADEYFVPALQARQAGEEGSGQGTGDGRQAGRRERGQAGSARPKQMEAARKSRAVIVELTEQKMLRAAYSDRQLDEVMVDFWFNHFNVFAGKGATRDYLTEYERDVIRPHVLGKFRDLLGATAQSPAMLFYLDNWQSARPDAQPMRPQRDARGAGFVRRVPGRTRGSAARFRDAAAARRRGAESNGAERRSAGSTRTTPAS